MRKVYMYLVLSLVMINTTWSQEYKRMISVGSYTVQEIQQEAEAYFAVIGTERGKGYNPYKRWEYQALRNMDANGMLKTSGFYFNELKKYDSYQNNKSAFAKTTTVGTWEQLGPTYWDQANGWNPGVGRVTSIAFENGNTNHIIVGAHSGGVWKTIDGGANWSVLTDNLSNLYVYALAIDPTNALTYFWGSDGGTIFKSTDGGSTWGSFKVTGNGNVNKILIDPTNTNKMYCSVESGGLYKSIDGGSNWSIINSSATNGYDVEFKPGDTNVIYASGNQFFKSIDGGATFEATIVLPQPWTQDHVSGSNNWVKSGRNQNNSVTPKTGSALGLFFIDDFTHPVTKLVSPQLNLIGATAPELKFSYTQVDWDGDIDELKVFYKTSLGGAWVELASYTAEVTSWSDITLSLLNPTSDYYIAFEGKSNFGRGVTLDDISVEDATLGIVFTDGFELEPNIFSSGPKMMGVSIDNPSIVYVLEASGGKFGGFYKSTDSGDTFAKLDHTGKNYFGYESDASDDRGQAPRDMDVAVNPSDADDVHIAGILTWRSTDGGVNFNVSSQWTPSSAANENIGYCHADIDILEYVDGKLYVGSDGGIYVANDPTMVSSTYFTDLTPGLWIRQFYKIGVSQTDPVVVSGGSQDNGTSVLTNGSWKDWLGADGMETFVDKNNNSILFGTSQFGSLYKSINGGDTWDYLPKPDDKGGQNTWNWIVPFEQDPIIQNTIYVAFDEVYKSVDSGETWTSISQNFAADIDELKIAPTNSNIMYASEGANLYKTTDGGATNWVSLTGFSGNINAIAIHPTDPNKVAIATTSSQKVYISEDGGVNWTSYLFDLPNFSARTLVWQNNGKDGLYLGMYYGVYYIDNTTSSSWQPFSNNLPNVSIGELEINTVTNKIYGATYGRGLWSSDLFEPSLGTDDYFELNSISLHPNPASKEVNLAWNKSEDVSIKIFNSLGTLMYYARNKSLINPLKIDVSQYATGLYFVKINNLKGVLTKKIIIN